MRRKSLLEISRLQKENENLEKVHKRESTELSERTDRLLADKQEYFTKAMEIQASDHSIKTDILQAELTAVSTAKSESDKRHAKALEVGYKRNVRGTKKSARR